ncbi:MAG: hypothetical protein K8R88_09490 [Armatimonadetes bacterium]|nr:hypothetical protein [Armatimonadota bacterium]
MNIRVALPLRLISVGLLGLGIVSESHSQVLFYEDFEDATPGQNLGQAPLNWTLLTAGGWNSQPYGVLANIHPGWPGNAISHLTATPNIASGYSQNVATPSSGIIELSFKGWAYSPLSGSTSVGIGGENVDRVEFRFEDNRFLLVSGISESNFGASFANATSFVYGFIDLTNLQAWMVVTDESGHLARSAKLPVPPGVRNLQILRTYEDRRSGQGMDLDNIKYQILPIPQPKSISGVVTLSDFSGQIAGQLVDVEVDDFISPAPEHQTATLGADGSYSISTFRQGDARITIKGSHWLRRHAISTDIPVGGLTGVNAVLINGDCNGDDVIDLTDYTAVVTDFNSLVGDPNYHTSTDLNGDGVIDLTDYTILVTQFNGVGD